MRTGAWPASFEMESRISWSMDATSSSIHLKARFIFLQSRSKLDRSSKKCTRGELRGSSKPRRSPKEENGVHGGPPANRTCLQPLLVICPRRSSARSRRQSDCGATVGNLLATKRPIFWSLSDATPRKLICMADRATNTPPMPSHTLTTKNGLARSRGEASAQVPSPSARGGWGCCP